MVNGPGDRMLFVGMGELTHPGKCMVCGSGMREEGYVRLGVYFEYEGEMFLCVTCVEEAGSTAGMLTKAEALQYKRGMDTYVDALTTTKADLDKANERLAGIDAYLRGGSGSTAVSDLIIGAPYRGPDEQGAYPYEDIDESISVEDSAGVSGVPDFDGESESSVYSNAGISL